ncbi:flagellar assembly protein FliX [Rhodovibrio sodomensis]|nr:flagellar assembly protein FliX [Rhodovibrio sodomensis]
MKIDRSSLHAATPLRRKDKAQDGGTFGDSLSAESAPASAADGGRAAGVAGAGTLLSLQEIPAGTTGERERGRQRGESLLARLEDLRDGLLMGRMAPDTVRRLADEVDQARAEIDDPGMNEILDEIELRAHVELAKLRR